MKILFFTPFSARNGAEMMLWYIIKGLNPEKISSAVYTMHAGELLSELPKNVPFFLPPTETGLTLKERIKRKLGRVILQKEYKIDSKITHVLNIHTEFAPDIWYINTILCPDIVELAVGLNIPFAVHFHELPSLYQNVSYQNLKQTIDGAHLLVGCSQKVCEKLKIMGGKNIALQYECVDIEQINSNVWEVQAIKDVLGIRTSFVWIMSGSIEYRKGTDIISDLAQQLGPDVTLIWLGPGSSGFSFYIEQELKYRNINNVMILGAKSNDYYNYLSLADGLVLTSREDPFPLVMIEAAALGKPIVSFNSGGVKEFVKEGMGIVIDSKNTKDLSEAMKLVMNGEIYHDKEVLTSRARDFDVKEQVKSWQEILFNNF